MSKHLTKEVKDKLVEAIKYNCGVDPTEKNRRTETWVDARRYYYVILREMGYTYQEISNSIGMHHTSVLHHLNSFDHLYKNDKKTRETYKKIRAEFVGDAWLNNVREKSVEELVDIIFSLEKSNKSLNLYNKELKKSLNDYKKFSKLIDIFNKHEFLLRQKDIHNKLNHILNGLYDT